MIEAYPLYWPDGWKRTPPGARRDSRFKVTFARARDLLFNEIRRLGAGREILSTNIPLRFDGLPYANTREPDDPGVAAYFTYRGKQMCFACDQYRYVRDNIYAVALTIEALRGIERWGASDMIERAFRGFQALPAAKDWRETLELTEQIRQGYPVTRADVEGHFRDLAKKHHPDAGGKPEDFHAIVAAREAALREVLE